MLRIATYSYSQSSKWQFQGPFTLLPTGQPKFKSILNLLSFVSMAFVVTRDTMTGWRMASAYWMFAICYINGASSLN
uniref:7TM_GPCR_Srx domain-containing protein n=1 Tax=Panagrellus redivivus TaxID=6233 RepID=A0A7E4VHY4_PANRE